MIRNLKALGLALVAVAALGAVMASSASAFFDSEAESTTIKGEQPAGAPHIFTVEAGSTTCEVAKFHSLAKATETGTIKGTSVGGGVFTSKSITIEPEYKECTNPLLGGVTVKTNGCHYEFTRTAAGPPPTGTVHIRCHTASPIEVVRSEGFNPCTIKVGPQELNGITYDNEGAGSARDVKVTANVTGISYSQSGLLCPGGTGNFTNGTYKGDVTVKGSTTGGAAVGIWVT